MQLFLILFFILLSITAAGQDASRFQEEILEIQKKYDTLWDNSKETIVFTGSSSIRLWKDLHESFPKHQIVNSGFGGSQASDLLAYTNELILQYNPGKVFIYEGDNDINDNKRPKEVISVFKEIISKIKDAKPETLIVIISAKPSLARWHLKRKYKSINRRFNRLCKKEPYLDYANIWNIMLDKKKLRQDIFIEDGLHLNSKGYELWDQIISNYIQ
ncbi:GDSL-type esterase/lipase family protein [uncultured Eudoraea sp.]|uniref:GDSL-type esterase/lipase family protein n=1 Tax=uncultured Eudoraea sp. TaxID=1035614 RepID=UPI00262D27A4|nr:GDSL-type esterase/lipase family protein [uncultured Eudoraea sp.]